MFTPYRICPLGAHSDHQYGFVSGFAIDKGIHITYSPTKSNVILTSHNFPHSQRFDISNIPDKQSDWGDYLRGATQALSHRYPLHYGLNGSFEGELPVGGLSSSAALTIVYLTALTSVNGIYLTQAELIDIALHAENDYVGVNCGKLDQSCEVYSRKDHLLYLDTKDDTYELIPQNPLMPPYEIAIFFSGLERSLAGTAFNMRVDELKSAAYGLMAFAGMSYGQFSEARLRHVPRAVFDEYKDRLPVNWMKRATHFYTEMERVHHGAEAWRNGDLFKFGQLVFESGYSSIYNYETGSPQLINLFEIMKDTDGIYGGRFSGAGFKGCCMALINPTYRDSIAKKVEAEYLRTFPELEGKFSIHFCHTADGVRVV
jgi:galactokinase/galacturonokinase